MKKPPFATFVLGNLFVSIGTGLVAAFVAYQFYLGNAPFLVLLIAWAIAGSSYQAFQKVDAYRQWQIEWAEMGGEAAPGFHFPRIPGLRKVLGLALWGVLAFLVVGLAQQPGMEIPVLLFWLATALLALRAIYGMFKKGRGKAAKSGRFIDVALCLPLPRQPSTLQQAYASLPEFCGPLLRAPKQPSREVV